MNSQPIRVLYSFPHRLGAGRICTTAWYEVQTAFNAGAQMVVIAGDLIRPFEKPIPVYKTFAYGRIRIPYRLLGTDRMCAIHDFIVARSLPKWVGKIDLIHAWPLAAEYTIKAASKLGIPVALERPNAHTRFAYEVVARECRSLGVKLPRGHEHRTNLRRLKKEETEYSLAYAILCPSEFVIHTFLEKGFSRNKLVRFIYGVDEKVFYPLPQSTKDLSHKFTLLFVGVAAVRKGLHFALDAWLSSKARDNGCFKIAGEFLPAYRRVLEERLKHPSIQVLGHRNDIPELMREADALVLPSIEEGFGLVCTEAMASGCVPLVSDACTDLCRHMENAMVHKVGDVESLTEHINILYENRNLLEQLRIAGLKSIPYISWNAAGVSLVEAYRKIIGKK